MLIIRRQQMDFFERLARQQFRERLAHWLRQVLPGETAAYTDRALLDWVAVIEERAARWGVATQYGIAQWASIALVIGASFDEEPAFQDYFRIPVLAPEDKLNAFVEGLNAACEDGNKSLSARFGGTENG